MHWMRRVAALCAVALACACGDTSTPPSVADTGTDDTGTDVAADTPSETGPDAGDATADTPDMGAPLPRRALLVDYEMRPGFMWAGVRGALESAGYAVDYRRWYPHVTPADIAGDFGMIVVAAGHAPSTPAARMRPDEVAHLEAFARAGGALTLLTEPGWSDAPFAENEWLFLNRLLERLQIPLRTGRATLIGEVWAPDGDIPPLHMATVTGYPGSLEWTLDLPVGYPAAEHPALGRFAPAMAAGWAAPLVCDGPEVAVLARTGLDVIVWQTLSEGDDQLAFPLPAVPLSAVALGPARAPVLVIPTSIALMPAHTERQSDEPMLDPSMWRGAGTFLDRAFGHAAELVDNPGAHTPGAGCDFLLDAGLFSAVASGHAALTPLAPTVETLGPVSALPVPDAPPAVELEEPLSPVELAAAPAWFQAGKAHIAYGDWDADLARQFDNGAAHGLGTYMIYIPPTWGLEGRRELADLAQTAEAGEVALFTGTIAVSLFSEDARDRAAKPRGRNGITMDVPSPVGDVFWDEGVVPFVLGVARAAAQNPGITGVQLDLELYGAGPLSLHRGMMLGDAEWAVVSDALGADASTVPIDERFAWLVDGGHMATAQRALADEVSRRATALREQARAIAPRLEFMIYTLDVSTGWFYDGLLHGLGTEDRPVTLLTYDLFTHAIRDDLAARGIHTRVVGGVLGVRLTPGDLGTALGTAREYSDGYWLFKLQDFPPSSEDVGAARLHGRAEDYWDEVAGVSAP